MAPHAMAAVDVATLYMFSTYKTAYVERAETKPVSNPPARIMNRNGRF